MRIIFAGTPQVALPYLEKLFDSEHEIVGVFTRPPARQGRGRRLVASAVAQKAEELGLTIFTPQSFTDPVQVQQLADLHADLAIVVAYGVILPPQVLSLPRWGWINVHFSQLPHLRGAAPVQRALIAGQCHTGISVFQIEKGLDTGPIWASTRVKIEPHEDAGQLLHRLSILGTALVEETIEKITQPEAKPLPQATEGITFAPRLSHAEGQVDWSLSAQEIANHIRGFTPVPGAWTRLPEGNGLKLGVVSVPERFDSHPRLSPGEVFADKHEVWVGSATMPIRLGLVAPAGRSWMEAAAWARGGRLERGLVFPSPVCTLGQCHA